MSTRALRIRFAVRFVFYTASAGGFFWVCYNVLPNYTG